MPATLHSVSELRNRFLYTSTTGVLRWRPVSFPEWSRGRNRPSHVRYETWARTTAGKPVRTTSINGVPHVRFLGRSYALARLVWALSHGKHPPADRFVVCANGEPLDVRRANLQLVDYVGLNKLRWARVSGAVPCNRSHLPDPEVLERWLSYKDGELHYRPVSLSTFTSRYKAADWAKHRQWLHDNAGKALLTRGGSRGRFPKVLFGSRWLSKADMVFAVCRGFHLPDGVSLVPVDGKHKNCRLENLRVEYPEGFDLDGED